MEIEESIVLISVNGIKSKKVLDTKKQICAGHKIKKQKEAFYKFTDHDDDEKIEFEETSPIEYEAKTDVLIKHTEYSVHIS